MTDTMDAFIKSAQRLCDCGTKKSKIPTITADIIMYKVDTWSNSATLSKLNIVKVTEKTVLTDKGFRYHKKCSSYELFDSFDIAKTCTKNHTKNHIESLGRRLGDAKSDLEMLNDLNESDLK